MEANFVPRKGTGLQLSIDEHDKRNLEELAAQLGYVRRTKPNITGLVEAIARQEIPLFQGGTLWSEEQQLALMKAVLALCQTADVVAVQEIINWVSEHPEFKPLYTAQIQDSCIPLLSPWVSKINQFIANRQPFQLSYQDAAGRLWLYTVLIAEITFRGDRNYLECWCEETEGNFDLPELRHNWSLRLDRIIDAAIVPIDGEWRSGLDTVDVEFELLSGLAYGYTERDSDIQVEWVSLDPPVKRVVRQISNSFWFIREILPYGKDCIVASPEGVLKRVIEQLEGALNNYSGT